MLDKPLHPGPFVRKYVIPPGMSVKEAAQRLDIGRPALSNLLNGKAALSPEMAVRLEKAFGADKTKLMAMQEAYDRQQRHAGDKGIAVRAFVPNFLIIKARQIENWADTHIDARTLLPVLLRKLVRTTGHDLTQVDFPGYDNAQRKGSDGFVEAGAATPWIPEGISYWEFGTDQKPGTKAESDYAARLATVDAAERADSQFIFITPRNWSGKDEWEKRKNAAGDWKTVRAFDASDLEQWLEESVPAQIWLAEQLNLPLSGYETLDQAWHRWANASEPHLVPEVFAPSITANKNTFKSWLNNPPDRPLVIAADSRDEALAFLACLFDDEEFQPKKDLAAVFTAPESLKTLITSSVPFIPIVHTDAAERELAPAHRRLHCILYRPRNAVDTEANIALDLLSYEAFEKSLSAMGIQGDRVERLARDSGRSPTILRRLLSPIPAIRTPAWAGDETTAQALVPLALLGAWHAGSQADQEINSYLSDRPYETIEGEIARLLRFDDSPVWSVGRYRGVASKVDALFAVAKAVIGAHLDRFFVAAEYVLSERDPTLDLPEKDRWAAALYNKTRDHSAALREGICETLVFLAVHGNELFQSRLGTDLESRVAGLVRQLLTPFTLEKLLSQDADLPRYAEAAPDEFLNLIEEDLQQPAPVILGLLKPVESGILGAWPSRTGLLWALEGLAWKPQTLSRVVKIFAQLSRQKIDDNWMNKPEASLEAIFSSWMPQTAAPIEMRMKALEVLTKQYPDVGWRICLEQIKPGSRIGHRSHRPRWRSDASGAGQVVTRKDMRDFFFKALDLLIGWQNHNEDTLGDLVESLQSMPEEDKVKIWDLIDAWSERASEGPKAALRERIRVYALSTRSRHRKLSDETRNRASRASERLLPNDPIIRHRWLFTETWVVESADEIEDEALDHAKREERISKQRAAAMKQIWLKKGFHGVTELLKTSNAAHVIGHHAAACHPTTESRAEFLKNCLAIGGELKPKTNLFMQGFLHALDNHGRALALTAAATDMDRDTITRLFVCAPFTQETWKLLEQFGEDVRKQYWRDVHPSWGRHTAAELTELVDRFLEAKRPRAAFHAVHMDLEEMETSRLKRLLREVATVDAEPAGHFKIDAYYIAEGMDVLQARPGVTTDEMAQLEFLYIGILDRSEHGIPNLENQISQSPLLFVHALVLAYKRSDDGEDPPGMRIENPEQRKSAATGAHHLLDKIKKMPGTDSEGKVNAVALTNWLTDVRRLCAEYARVDIGDIKLGDFLSRAPAGEDGVWPCEAVCQAIESISSSELAEGFVVGTRNSRGVYVRGEGGAQEREIAANYRSWAEHRRFEYPYVGRVLEQIAASYDREAGHQDSEANVRKRLRY